MLRPATPLALLLMLATHPFNNQLFNLTHLTKQDGEISSCFLTFEKSKKAERVNLVPLFLLRGGNQLSPFGFLSV